MNRKRDLYLLSEAYSKINESEVHPDDTVTPNEGPGGVLEIQPDGQHPQPPKQEEDALNHASSDLLARLSDMSEDFASDDIGVEINNLATKVMNLLQGVDRYSKANPQVNEKQRELLMQIGELVTQLPLVQAQTQPE